MIDNRNEIYFLPGEKYIDIFLFYYFYFMWQKLTGPYNLSFTATEIYMNCFEIPLLLLQRDLSTVTERCFFVAEVYKLPSRVAYYFF